MKVFFVGSPRALRQYKREFTKIYQVIEELGHENNYDLIVKSDQESFYKKNRAEIAEHYRHTIKCLQTADVVIIETSIHSLSMGYLARMGEELNKPVIILYQPDSEPFFFSGNDDERFFLIEYTYDTIKKALHEAFDYAEDAMNLRFNMYITSQMHAKLKEVAKQNGTTCSTLVRQLLQRELK